MVDSSRIGPWGTTPFDPPLLGEEEKRSWGTPLILRRVYDQTLGIRLRRTAPLYTLGDSMCVIPAKLVLVKTGSGNPEKDKVPILFERERGIVMVEYPQTPGTRNPTPLLLMFESQRTM